MNLEKKLLEWKDNNLLSLEQTNSILEFERNNSKSKIGIFTIITLGCVVLGIGVVALIASNWEEIPDLIKMGIDFLVLLLLGSIIYLKYDSSNTKIKDSLIVVYIIIIMVSIGLISQIYNSGGELYQALFLWSIITLPIVLHSESIFPSQLWLIIFLYVVHSYLKIIFKIESYNFLMSIYILCIPTLFLLLGIILNFSNKNSLHKFRNSSFFWSFLLFGINTISVNLLGRDENQLSVNFKLLYLFYFLLSFTISYLLYKNNKKISFLFIIFIIIYFNNYYFHLETEITQFMNAFLFIISWFLISFIFLNLKFFKLFEFSVIIIGLRFLFIYFEIFSSLLLTGLGLIFSGIFIISISILYLKIKDKLLSIVKRLV